MSRDPQHEGPASAEKSTADPKALAEDYLDMWQDHLRALATDPKTAAGLGQFLTLMAGSSAALSALAQQTLGGVAAGGMQPTGQEEASNNGSDTNNGTSTAGAEPAYAAADAGDLDVAGLLRRIDELERRLAKLEGDTAGAG